MCPLRHYVLKYKLETIERKGRKEAVKKLQQVSLSNDVIHNRIVDMSENILEQVVADINASPVKVLLRVDESTDVSNCSQLIAVVRYVKNKEIEESFLFCQSLKTTSQAKDVFDMIKEFSLKHQIHLDKIGSIFTDGAPAMSGNRSEFAALLRKEIPNLKSTHCFLHRHALAAKTLPLKLKKALQICVKVVNTIRGRALNHRSFRLFCEELGKEHTEVRWLSCGRVLSRLFELRDEIKEFLCKVGNEMAEYFETTKFIQNLAYLAEMFTALNELNRSLQGQGISVIHACEKLSAFKEKLQLWIRRVKQGNFVNFPSLQEKLKESASLHPDLVSTIAEHLQILSTAFDGYFSCGELQTYDY